MGEQQRSNMGYKTVSALALCFLAFAAGMPKLMEADADRIIPESTSPELLEEAVLKHDATHPEAKACISYLDEMVMPLVQHLAGLANAKGVTSGAFVVEDPGGQFYEQLSSFPTKNNGRPGDCNHYCPYHRASSHMTKWAWDELILPVTNEMQWGVDLPPATVTRFLGGGMTGAHLLFFPLKKGNLPGAAGAAIPNFQYLYVKIEGHGMCCLGDKCAHSLSYLKTRADPAPANCGAGAWKEKYKTSPWVTAQLVGSNPPTSEKEPRQKDCNPDVPGKGLAIGITKAEIRAAAPGDAEHFRYCIQHRMGCERFVEKQQVAAFYRARQRSNAIMKKPGGAAAKKK